MARSSGMFLKYMMSSFVSLRDLCVAGCLWVQGFDKVVPSFEALPKFHGGEGFEEVVPLSKTHRNSACLKG